METKPRTASVAPTVFEGSKRSTCRQPARRANAKMFRHFRVWFGLPPPFPPLPFTRRKRARGKLQSEGAYRNVLDLLDFLFVDRG